MAISGEGRSLAAETEPLGLLTEGVAGIAVIVLAIIGLAQTNPGILASIATIVIGVGLMVQGFNTAAEYARVLTPSPAVGQTVVSVQGTDVGSDIMIQFAAGITGIVLGILGLLGIHTGYLIPAAVIVFGAALLLAGALAIGRGPVAATVQPGMPAVANVAGSAGASGLEIVVGVAAIVLGILAILLTATSGVLTLVALLAIGAALLVVSASFGGAVMRLFMATATA
jgi:hypothetical protein